MNERVAKSLDLHYRDGDEWRPIPHWAKFLISLGASVASAEGDTRRIVVAVSVPSPCYAASFIALGRILAEPIVEPDPAAYTSHFEFLAALPARSPLIYFRRAELVHGPFLGTDSNNGEDGIWMVYQKPKQPPGKCFIPKRWSLRVELEPDHKGPAPRTGAGRLRKPKPFVERFFTREEHYRILCNTTKPVTVIGDTNRFRAETVVTPFAVPADERWIEGSLQDLIRVSKFAAGAIGCRSEILAKGRDPALEAAGAHTAGSLVILDGASAAIRRLHQYNNPNLVAVLQRTEPEYLAAVDLLNARYINRADDFEVKASVSPSPAISIMAHTEVRS